VLFAAKDVVITYGGEDVTAHVMEDFEIVGIDETNDSKPFGERYNESKKTGDTTIQDFTFRGLYDDVNNGPKRLWDVTTMTPSPSDEPVSMVITYGTPAGSPADSITIPVLVKQFKTTLSRNNIHKYEAVFTKGRGDITRVP